MKSSNKIDDLFVRDLDIEKVEDNQSYTQLKVRVAAPVFQGARVIKCPIAPTEKFASNAISTSKYSIITWAPKSLLWQFRRVANVYFLIISILSAQYFSPKNPFTMAGTFAAVLIFTMFKEAYEDYYRHKQDKAVNAMICHKVDLRINRIVDVQSKDVKVGDILCVKNGELLPADLVFLASSDVKGLGFVNTMNLDGEVNLKEKVAVEMTNKKFEINSINNWIFEIECDQPNMSLVKWNCNFTFDKLNKEPLSMKQLLLRGTSIQNTDHAYGVVIYTGHETKIMLNSKQAPSKASNVLKRMNMILYTVFGFQMCLCLLLAGLSVQWQDTQAVNHTYINLHEANMGLTYLIQVLTYIVAYSHLIPISLYVALEIVKLAIAYMISQDLNMYYSEKSAACRSSDLVEELGQVEFIFSDKTGTLTCNEMEFRKCEINGKIYGELKRTFGIEGSDECEIFNNPEHVENMNFRTFFEFMAICHSVFPAQDVGKGEVVLQASSPDELALVEASKNLGISFFERSEGKVKLREIATGEVVEWDLLVEIPFNSDRKRMSVIVKNPRTNEYILMTKGADSMMLPLLKNSLQKDNLNKTLMSFALDGLRTLVMAQKVLTEKDFETWHTAWKSIMMSNDPAKEAYLDELGASIEIDLNLVGCSAIEDKLQHGVPKAIALLMSANIRVWVLTGDKEETAIEIGKSCNLLQQYMEIIRLSSTSSSEIIEKLERYNSSYKLDTNNFSSLEHMKKGLSKKLGIVIDGLTLTWVLENSQLRTLFFKLGFLSSSCICCRVSPAQKAQVVNLAKSHGKWVTLSIGDGANDVSMIQEAHIGVGISGKEGAQAVQASDFAITQFRFLTRMILVHGRWAYKRITWFVCYYFYKNITVVFTELWFAFFNGFSGQIFFLDWLPMLYNSFWTSWPCMVTYLLEQDIDAERSLRYPGLYVAGQKNLYLNIKRFWIWVGLGIWHGSVSFWIPTLLSQKSMSLDGEMHNLWWVSTLSFSLIINIITLKLYIENMHWNLYSGLTGILSVVIYYLTIIVLNTDGIAKVFQNEARGVVYEILSSGYAWIVLLFVTMFAMIPDFLIATFGAVFSPNPLQKHQLLSKRTDKIFIDNS